MLFTTKEWLNLACDVSRLEIPEALRVSVLMDSSSQRHVLAPVGSGLLCD